MAGKKKISRLRGVWRWLKQRSVGHGNGHVHGLMEGYEGVHEREETHGGARFTVKLDPSLSLAELVRQGNYDICSPPYRYNHIDEESLRFADKDEEIQVELVPLSVDLLDKVGRGARANASCTIGGFHMAGLIRLLHIGIQHPELQRETRIFGLHPFFLKGRQELCVARLWQLSSLDFDTKARFLGLSLKRELSIIPLHHLRTVVDQFDETWTAAVWSAKVPVAVV